MAEKMREEAAIGWRFLLSKRWFGYYAMLLIFAIACVFLGNWQFARRAEARAEIYRLDHNYDSPAVPLATEVPNPDRFDENTQKWRTVQVVGEYTGLPVLARGRPGPSGVGSDILQAVRTDSGTLFWIDRGWVPADTSTADLPPAPRGKVTVLARLRAAEPRVQGRENTAKTVGSIHIADLLTVAGFSAATPSYTASYGMLISEKPTTEHGVLPDKPERDEGPHLSYALQWYVFIVIAVAGVGYAATREYRTLNAGSRQLAAADAKRAAKKAKRKPSDAEEEDALLDG